MKITKQIAIIGTGPASLMAASVLSQNPNFKISIFEKKHAPATKLLIAGKSGLNISNSQNKSNFWQWYDGPKRLFEKIFNTFGVDDWIAFIENLGIKTFEGTSKRYFIKGLKAAPLVKKWITTLKERNVKFHYQMQLSDFSRDETKNQILLEFNKKETLEFDACVLALGGASYEKAEISWPKIFTSKKISFSEFKPANVGYEVDWKKDFLAEVEGLPLKNISISSSQGKLTGEMTITKYGLEGTPIYTIKEPQEISIDLKPNFTELEILSKLQNKKENLSPLRMAKKYLKLSSAALALLFHHAPSDSLKNKESFVYILKNFPIRLIKKRNLKEAISSSGGIDFSEVDDNLMLKKFPGLFLAGEMLNWNAPTGGFLIQACASQGYYTGDNCLNFLLEKKSYDRH